MTLIQIFHKTLLIFSCQTVIDILISLLYISIATIKKIEVYPTPAGSWASLGGTAIEIQCRY